MDNNDLYTASVQVMRPGTFLDNVHISGQTHTMWEVKAISVKWDIGEQPEEMWTLGAIDAEGEDLDIDHITVRSYAFDYNLI